MAQKYHVLREYANGVMDEKGKFFPFTAATSSSSAIAAKPHVRYYIKSISLSASQAGAHAAAVSGVTGVVNGRTVHLIYQTINETFAASGVTVHVGHPVGILLDLGTTVTITIFQAYTIVYAEVIENPGEYS